MALFYALITAMNFHFANKSLASGFSVAFIAFFFLIPSNLYSEEALGNSTFFTLDTRYEPAFTIEVSDTFTLDTLFVPTASVTESGAFTLDTRYGLGAALADSGLFMLDTRYSASIGITDSGLFTLDTINLAIASVAVSGRVTDTGGSGLGGAVVLAVVNNNTVTSTRTDGNGYYALPLFPAGTYELRASVSGYLTAYRRGLVFTAGQTATWNFSLSASPPVPATVAVQRTPGPAQAAPLPPTPAQLKVWLSGGWTSGVSLDPAKMTIVLTHGWKVSYHGWPTAMAAQLTNPSDDVSNLANIVAWDWENEANTLINLNASYSRTPANGNALGAALQQSLGNNYQKPVHFLGHSLGTLVNGRAANYLHEHGSTPHDWRKTHMTLFDDAEVANAAGPLEEAGIYGVLGDGNAVAGSLIASGLDLLRHGWVSPIPNQSAWRDNYISLVGLAHDGAVNVCLAQGPYFSESLINYHSYAHEFYRKTVLNPSASAVGYRNSFEKLGLNANLVDSPPLAPDSYFAQTSRASEFYMLQLDEPSKLHCQASVAKAAGQAVLIGAVSRVDDGVTYVGNIVTRVSQKVESRAKDFVNTVVTQLGTSGSSGYGFVGNLWSVQVIFTTHPPVTTFAQQGGKSALAMPANSPAYAWFNVSVPSNATAMTFDFLLHGDGANDCLVFGVEGTNQFALEAQFIPQDAEHNSGAINVTPWAGRTVEFFFGLMGGTSTNATVSVDGIRFYAQAAPTLTMARTASGTVLSWPVSASDFALETSPVLSGTNQWSAVTDRPDIIDFSYTITNSPSGPSAFFRLNKP